MHLSDLPRVYITVNPQLFEPKIIQMPKVTVLLEYLDEVLYGNQLYEQIHLSEHFTKL